MQIMAFGDIHEYVHTLPSLEDELRQADLVLITGDMTRWRGPETAQKVLHAVQTYNPNILAQVGNTDSWDTHHYLTSLDINLHGQGRRFGDLGIFGVGGSNQTPFYSPTELSEDEIAEAIMSGYADIEDAPYKILVAPLPPLSHGSRPYLLRPARGEHQCPTIHRNISASYLYIWPYSRICR